MAERVAPGSADGVLADLGVSSMQFDDAGRGFSFQADGPLDMRMNPHAELSADQVVNQFDESNLADLIYEFGEERRSRRIARAIVRARPIKSTAHLAQVISAAARPMNQPRGKGIHPATLTFQAIRIYVNRELEDLAGAAAERAPGGKAGWKAGGDQLPLAGRPHGEGCHAGRSPRWRVGAIDQEAGDCLRRRDGGKLAGAFGEVARGGADGSSRARRK